MKNITVVAEVKAKAGMEEKVKDELMKLINPTRAEKGCVSYDLHQLYENPCEFLFYETWTGQEALGQHFETAHIKAAMNAVVPMLAQPMKLTVWNKVD